MLVNLLITIFFLNFIFLSYLATFGGGVGASTLSLFIDNLVGIAVLFDYVARFIIRLLFLIVQIDGGI